MAVPVWNQSFAVNVKRCDEDHKKLFALIQRLHDTVEPLPERSVALEAIQELDEYAKAHFSAEEALLEQTNYPALASHRLQHRTFHRQSGGTETAYRFRSRHHETGDGGIPEELARKAHQAGRPQVFRSPQFERNPINR
jgi:hemerythrin-like metal-binding protein